MADSQYRGANKAGEVCTIWATQAADEMGKMVEQCRISDATLQRLHNTGLDLPHKAGFAAEALHAESFNLEAILQESDLRAFTDRFREWPLSGNDPTQDIIVMRGPERVQGAQLKYYQSAKDSANALRDPKYGAADALIAPADQVPKIKTIAREQELRNQDIRPQVAEAAREVRQKASDRLQAEGVESRPLTLDEAKTIARQDENGKGAHRKVQGSYQNSSTLKHGLRAAQSAAIVTTVIAGSINTIHCLEQVRRGEMAPDAAYRYILKNTAIAAADSAAKAGASTAAVSVAMRTMPELFGETVLRQSLASGGIAAAAICAVDLVECLVLVAAGKMTLAELETRTGKNVLQSGAGVLGSSIGAALGAPAGPAGMLVGALVGGLITSVASTIAIDNHIEKPFADAIRNTQALVQAQYVMRDSLAYLATAQQGFASFRISCRASERQFDSQMEQAHQLGQALRGRLDRL